MVGTSPDNVKRILWPQEDFAELVDEFVVRDCRIWFRGGVLEVQALSEGADTMAVLNDYTAALRNRLDYSRLLSVEEFGVLPPRAITMAGRAKQDRERRRAQLGEARRDTVASSHPRLSCPW
jgi:hypothetical protein